MDLKDIESTSGYAIQAVYDKYWDLVPKNYRLPDMTKIGFDIRPYYDPELTFENRTQYKLTKVKYPERTDPWIIATWNTEQGVQKSELSNRRMKTMYTQNPDDEGFSDYRFSNAYMTLNMCFYSNSLMALLAFQENYQLKIREKDYAIAHGHSVLKDFSVALNTINTNMVKLPRDKGTICYLFFQVTIDYPIIGYSSDAYLIERITLDTYGSKNDLLTKDIITEKSP